jgi:acetaldehyde dehydrogenase / alcohol dehydrogenase
MDTVEKLAYEAYEDQCIPANPRVPLVKDLIQILKDAYYGNFMENKPNKK